MPNFRKSLVMVTMTAAIGVLSAGTAVAASVADFYRGSNAWLHGDLEKAERFLMQAHTTASAFEFSAESLRNLARTYVQMGQPERAGAIAAFLRGAAQGQNAAESAPQ